MLNKIRVLLCILLVLTVKIFAQNWQQDDAYMIPTKVYVGDRANFVLPLPGFTDQQEAEISPVQIPSSPDIDIHRVAFERRPAGNRLIIEFSAYAPGILALPAISIAGETFSGLAIEISSILDSGPASMILSGPALPLAIPGTSLLVYGTISASVITLLLALWALFWGRRQFKAWLEVWKRRRLLVAMWRIERRLRRDLAKGSGGREILDMLSIEFRSFLAYFYAMNCRAMTASEFGRMVLIEEYPGAPGSEFLMDFFNRCDCIRFSGEEINGDETLGMLGETRSFLRALDRAMRKKIQLPKEAASPSVMFDNHRRSRDVQRD